ncbi:MAG: DeoR/GlpR transcriptional regulator [Euzebyales bacterium]|nr:DeoR/GlpR transcriptional regulator [Euzebyales bacterium]
MLTEQRRNEVLRAVRGGAGEQTSALAERFGVSEMTIRRDLDELAKRGLVQRVRGGALEPGCLRHEPPFHESTSSRMAEKERVGRAAARMVRPGDTVIIDVGTTALQLARYLHGREGLTVVTNNLAVYEELMPDEAIDILLLGGMVRRNYRSLVGFLTEDCLRGIRADLAFIGISGISDDLALLDSTVEEIPGKRAMVRASQHVVLLADGAKFWGAGLGRVAGVDILHTIVTTDDAPEDRIKALTELGVEVIVA